MSKVVDVDVVRCSYWLSISVHIPEKLSFALSSLATLVLSSRLIYGVQVVQVWRMTPPLPYRSQHSTQAIR